MRLRREGVALQTLDEQAVILNLDRSEYLSVNEAGTFLVELLQQPCTREELIQQLSGRYDIDAEIAARDVDAFVARLTHLELLSGP